MITPEELTSNNINDLIAAEYGLTYDTNFVQFLKYLLIHRLTKSKDICLDIGIANGILSIPIAQKVKEVHGVDISRKMLEECRSNLSKFGISNIHLYERSVTDLLFDEATFDIVFCYSTLLLIPNPMRAYQEIGRVLKPGGLAILDITGKFNLSQLYWSRYYRRHGHFGLNAYSLPKIRAIFKTLNLEVIETHATGLLDQWKYIPILRKAEFLEKLFHATTREPDLDYKISQKIPWLANRWYFVLRKGEGK